MSPPVGVFAVKIWSGRITPKAVAPASTRTTGTTYRHHGVGTRVEELGATGFSAITDRTGYPGGSRNRSALARLFEDDVQVDDLTRRLPPAVLTTMTRVEGHVAVIRP